MCFTPTAVLQGNVFQFRFQPVKLSIYDLAEEHCSPTSIIKCMVLFILIP